jgi:hypothetical protein
MIIRASVFPILAAVWCLTASSAVAVESSDDDKARNSISGCEVELKDLGSNTLQLGLCLGILKGLHYLSADVCIPPALSLADIAGVLDKFFDAHPVNPSADFRDRSLEGMRSAWPCGDRKDI